MDGWKLVLVLPTVVALTAAGCGAGRRSHVGSPTANPAPIEVGGQTLERVVAANGKPSTLARECARAAKGAAFPIACPAALPRGSNPFWGNGFSPGECAQGASGTVRLRRWTWVGAYVPIGARLGHIVVASAPQVIDPRSFIYLVGTVEPRPSRRVKVAGKTMVRGHAAKYVHPSLNPRFDPRPRVGGTVFMGHTVLIWTEHGHTYAIGIAGPRIHARSVEAAMARQLTFAMPPRA